MLALLPSPFSDGNIVLYEYILVNTLGRQTFIRLPEKTASGEMPVLLVRKGSRDVLVNYRVKDATMVVDGLFERIALIVGVDGDQEKVEVIRGKK
jgi:type IV secretion system protein VirB9